MTATTVHCPTPNSVWPIFIAASITRPVVITLNTSYHVEHQPEIYGAEAAQERGGPARVAKLVELDVAFGLSTLRSRAS